jgi:hypothetical protein
MQMHEQEWDMDNYIHEQNNEAKIGNHALFNN